MLIKTLKIPELTQKQEQNFWAKVDKTPGFGPNGDCWEWIASKNECGYGWFRIGKYTYKAHRAVYKLIYGLIPINLCILHSCDNPSCVNPSHLWLGTQIDNIRDKVKKGRGRPGGASGDKNGMHTHPESTSPRAKLTADQVLEIRAEYAKGKHSYRELGNKWGINHSVIGKIIRRETWKHT